MKLTRSDLLDVLAFILATLWFVHFRVVGDLYISELILGIVFLFIFKRHGYKLKKSLPKRIIIFGILWLVGQVITDIFRMTPIESLAKGWASIIFFLVDFGALYMLLYGNVKRLRLFITGFAIGGILRCYVDPGYGFDVEPWKFGFAFPTMILSVLMISWLTNKKIIQPLIGEIFFVILGILSIYLNARSMGGTMILTAFLLFISRQLFFHKLLFVRWNFNKKIIISITALSFVVAILSAYQWVGESGLLPEKSQHKYDLTKSALKGEYGMFGMALAGRIEIFSSIPAVIDSPIIGHGSWAENPKYRKYLYNLNKILGTDYSEQMLAWNIEKNNLIPAHSHLMQSWVWAGFLGALFWIVVLIIIAKSMILSIRFPHVFTALTIFISITVIWDLLFSPFSSFMRFRWGWELVLIIMAYGIAKEIAKYRQEKIRHRVRRL